MWGVGRHVGWRTTIMGAWVVILTLRVKVTNQLSHSRPVVLPCDASPVGVFVRSFLSGSLFYVSRNVE